MRQGAKADNPWLGDRCAEFALTMHDGGFRRCLARRHHATITCPITTGIFAWIAAHAAAEAEAEGWERTTPYWRTLKTGGELNPKYPGGARGLKRRLTAEGHRVVQRGKRFFVADFETRLAPLS
jgi:hypothetical protein